MLREGLQSGKPITAYQHNYIFIGTREIENDLGLFLTGLLVKYKDVEEEIVDPEAKDFGDIAIQNKSVAKVRFFIHSRTGLIAYHRAGNDITEENFRDRLVK
jgi:hypothetical protein